MISVVIAAPRSLLTPTYFFSFRVFLRVLRVLCGECFQPRQPCGLRRIHSPLGYATPENFANLRHGFERLMLRCLRREPADMRRGNYFRMVRKRGSRLLVVIAPDIQRTTCEPAGIQRAQQSRLIDQVAARSIHDKRAW